MNFFSLEALSDPLSFGISLNSFFLWCLGHPLNGDGYPPSPTILSIDKNEGKHGAAISSVSVPHLIIYESRNIVQIALLDILFYTRHLTTLSGWEIHQNMEQQSCICPRLIGPTALVFPVSFLIPRKLLQFPFIFCALDLMKRLCEIYLLQ